MPIAFVDLKKRPPAPGELKRFAQKFGARALLDEDSKAYKQANLGYLSMGDGEVIERVMADPELLRLPLSASGTSSPSASTRPPGRRGRVASRRASHASPPPTVGAACGLSRCLG